MTARDVFGIIVRATGFGLVVLSLFDFAGAALRMMQLSGYSDAPMDSILIAGISYLLLGTVIFFAAELIVRLAYGRAPAP